MPYSNGREYEQTGEKLSISIKAESDLRSFDTRKG
jgi:hypothetical protein